MWLSELQFPHLKMGNNNTYLLIGYTPKQNFKKFLKNIKKKKRKMNLNLIRKLFGEKE